MDSNLFQQIFSRTPAFSQPTIRLKRFFRKGVHHVLVYAKVVASTNVVKGSHAEKVNVVRNAP
jgi:hypothetical protein